MTIEVWSGLTVSMNTSKHTEFTKTFQCSYLTLHVVNEAEEDTSNL